MTDRLINFVWMLGIRAFRLSRRANLSNQLQPLFIRAAGVLPTPTRDAVATLPHGATLSMPPGYRDTRTVITGLFQQDETRLLQRLTRPGMTFVDVGAYVGYFTILASHFVGTRGHVFAFEPDVLAYNYLTRNIESNRCLNAVAVNKGISDTVTTATLVRDPKGPESFLTKATVSGQLVVDTITLDDFCDLEGWPRVDIIKMNIEGSELAALRGMRRVSANNSDLQLLMEFNPTAMSRAGVERDGLTRALHDLGFRRGQIVERDLELIPHAELLPTGAAVYNVLLTK